jgi:hypothetical protein
MAFMIGALVLAPSKNVIFLVGLQSIASLKQIIGNYNWPTNLTIGRQIFTGIDPDL